MRKYQNIIDKIRDIYKEPEAFIPLHAPLFTGNEKKYLNECIDSTFVSSVGKFVNQFEKGISEYTGAKEAVVCVNGTNALHLALQLVGVQKGDEVITQALTFIATANAISYAGAHPIFLDVDRETMGLSPDSVKYWLEINSEIRGNACYNKHTGNKISACIPMHTFGHPARIEELLGICEAYHIELIEDAAESIGSFYKGKHTGTFGKIGVLSFNGNKTITSGGGGMLLFNDQKLAKRAKYLSTQAKIPHAWEFRHDEIGYNYRMPNINAALGLAQLEQLPAKLAIKKAVANVYQNLFAHSDIEFFMEPLDCKSSYWLNVILLKDRKERDLFLKETNEAGVMTRPLWELMTDLPMFENCQYDELVVSKEFCNRVVNLPSSVHNG